MKKFYLVIILALCPIIANAKIEGSIYEKENYNIISTSEKYYKTIYSGLTLYNSIDARELKPLTIEISKEEYESSDAENNITPFDATTTGQTE